MGVLVAYLDLLTTPSKAQFANGLGTALYRDLVGFKDRAIHKVTDFLHAAPYNPGSAPVSTALLPSSWDWRPEHRT